MGTKLLTFLLLGLYLFLPPVLCIGEGNHVAIENAGHARANSPAHAAVNGTEICQPHEHHHHGSCVDLALVAETTAKVSLDASTLELYEAYLMPQASQGRLLASAETFYFTDNLLVSLHSTVLLI